MGDSLEGISWKRVSVEAFVIVGSILLAFAVDAAWDKSLKSADESVLLESLRTDMLSNRAEIERVDSINGQAIRAYLAFIGSSPTELGAVDPDSALALLGDLLRTAAFTPFDGSLRGMDRSILSSPEVRRTLGAWEGLAEDLVETGRALYDGSREVWQAAADVSPEVLLRQRDIPLLRGDIRPLQRSDIIPTATLAALRAEPEFVAAFAAHYRFLSVGQIKLMRLSASTDSLTALLEAAR